jgi:hypothetical protein
MVITSTAIAGLFQRHRQALAVVLADIGVGDDGHPLALAKHRSDPLAGAVDQARADDDVIGAIAQAHGDGADHGDTPETK